ncbi:transposase [Oceanithermus profundus]
MEERPRRKPTRLADFDYRSPGAYFVTLVAHKRVCLFGEVVEGKLKLNALGRIVEDVWTGLPDHYPHIELDAFVVMPNHFHGLVILQPDPAVVGEGFKPSPTAIRRHGLSEIVRALKTFSARRINALRGTPGQRLWQRSYHDRIVRNETELNRLRAYIATNTLCWHLDRENPAAGGERGAAPRGTET